MRCSSDSSARWARLHSKKCDSVCDVRKILIGVWDAPPFMLVPRAALTAAIVSSCSIFISEIAKQHESGRARIVEEPAASLRNACGLCKRPLTRELLAYPCHLQTQTGALVAPNQECRMAELAVKRWRHCVKQQLDEDKARP